MQTLPILPENDNPSWLDRSLPSLVKLNIETVLFLAILLATIFTRFYNMEPRVMSHDETSHTYFSWFLYKGNGYSHDPITHGPLQFHLVALSYFLFGDSDTSARLPVAVFGVLTVAFTWKYRRYLGRFGALVAALGLTISPYMLYYTRYVRNEAFVALFGLMMLYAMLRYIESGQPRFLYLFTTVTILHFAAKETSFIYTAQALLFLGLYFIHRLSRQEWHIRAGRVQFFLSLITSLLFLAGGLFLRSHITKLDASGQPLYPQYQVIPSFVPLVLIGIGLLLLAWGLYNLITGYGLAQIRRERSFDLLMLLGTLVLPQLSPFISNFIGWAVPDNATKVRAMALVDIVRLGAVLLPAILISIALGLWWNRRQWLINAAIWYGIFTVLFTTMFTNGAGFFTGMVGSLGYWLAQQAVNRGSQPWYYYLAIQVPIYEFLPAIGSLVALAVAIRKWARKEVLDEPVAGSDESPSEPLPEKAPVFALLAFWSLTSLLAYTIAGEKMPWLTVHITLPMILLTGWGVGKLMAGMDWAAFRQKKGWIVLGLLVIFIPAVLAALRSALGANPPFAGKSLPQLSATSDFLIAFASAVGAVIGLFYILKDWLPSQIRRVFTLVFLFVLSILTARTALTAALINYDLATEFLVYAHSAPGDKIALQQITDMSRRLTGGLDMPVAYDDDTTYPYWWYLRNFTNQRFYGANPTRDLRDVPAILVGEKNFDKIEPIVGQAYYRFDYNRIWWPNQDYYNLTWERIWFALTDPLMREAVFKIWLNRDFSTYAQATNRQITLQDWSPVGKMRLYLRKDIVAQLWDYGVSPSAEPILADPYEGKQVARPGDQSIGIQGTQPGQMMNPRDVAVASDGSLYVADTINHRIQHFTSDGSLLQTWGSYANLAVGEAPGGTLYEPWSVAVGPDGSVYVADTWNHRIQKFTASGEFVSMWGFFGQAETPFALWGPRDIAVDEQGRVFVTDTGNKRVVVYDADGNFVTQFGSVGFEPGQFNEPVGIAVDNDGLVYIADTWNQRIQVMTPDGSGNYLPLLNWEVVGWYGESLDNKPYLAIDAAGNLYASDPEGYRILHFTRTGTFVDYFGDFGSDMNGLNLPNGLAIDPAGGLWVADSGNFRVLHIPTGGQ